MNQHPGPVCRLCGTGKLALIRKGIPAAALSSANFAITDRTYGTTLDVYGCRTCSLKQCFAPEVSVLDYYTGLTDKEYEATRKERLLQAERIVAVIKAHKAGGSLIDIGAGSGILVEAALAAGYDTSGYEPSRWLQQEAVNKGLPVIQGVFDGTAVSGKADVISIIDVIEHVEDPYMLLAQARSAMHEEGVLVLTTPDVNSLCARLLGHRWWHYRIAHITYFNKRTLSLLLDQAGFEIVRTLRPSWYFSADYLLDRIGQYLPAALRPRPAAWLKRLTVRLNLFDSLMVIAAPKPSGIVRHDVPQALRP